MVRKDVEFDPKTGEPIPQEFSEDVVQAKAVAADGITVIVTPNGGKAVFPSHLWERPDWKDMPDEGTLHDEG